jgi:hypothetical protein
LQASSYPWDWKKSWLQKQGFWWANNS